MTDPIIAIIPVSPLDRAKRRLAGVLDLEQRRTLTLAALETVIAAAKDAGLAPALLTRDPALRGMFPGVRHLAERQEAEGLNPALESALEEVAHSGPVTVAILHADLPLATGAALQHAVAGLASAPAISLVRSRDGGTNVMVMAPLGRFRLAYGPRSFARHVASAWAAGMTISAVDDPDLALDLDTPADIAALLGHPLGPATAAGRLLAGWGLAL